MFSLPKRTENAQNGDSVRDHDLDILHSVNTKHKVADALSRQLTKRRDAPVLDFRIPVVLVASSAQERCSKVTDYLSKPTNNEKTEPRILALYTWLNAKEPDDFRDTLQTTVKVTDSTVNFNRNGLVVRLLLTDGAVQNLAQRSTFPTTFQWRLTVSSLVIKRIGKGTTQFPASIFGTECARMYTEQYDSTRHSS